MRPYEKVIVDSEVVENIIRTVRKQVAFILQGIFRMRKEQKRWPFNISYLGRKLKTLAALFKQLHFTVRNFNSSMTLALLQSAASQLLNIKLELLSQDLQKSDSFRKTVKVTILIADNLWNACWSAMSKHTVTKIVKGKIRNMFVNKFLYFENMCLKLFSVLFYIYLK